VFLGLPVSSAPPHPTFEAICWTNPLGHFSVPIRKPSAQFLNREEKLSRRLPYRYGEMPQRVRPTYGLKCGVRGLTPAYSAESERPSDEFGSLAHPPRRPDPVRCVPGSMSITVPSTKFDPVQQKNREEKLSRRLPYRYGEMLRKPSAQFFFSILLLDRIKFCAGNCNAHRLTPAYSAEGSSNIWPQMWGAGSRRYWEAKKHRMLYS
jgi:hypothetical protein